MSYKSITLKPRKEESLLRFHPWLFSGAIASVEPEIQEGEVVDIIDSKGHFVARGHFQIGSIAVRVLTFDQSELIDSCFWESRVRSAYEIRKSLHLAQNPDNNTYRLIHGEGDLLPGLIVDIYADTAVMQAHSVGMHEHRMDIAKAIEGVMQGVVAHIYYKSETTLPYKAPIEAENGYLIGSYKSSLAMENGLLFKPDWIKGQKTGFFVDQRDNRALLEKYAKGRRVLNMFCYTGGFSFYAMRGGAALVHSVDSSAKAVELTHRNMELNFPSDPRHAAFAEDAFKYMADIKGKYDLIILDPPAFAKHRGAIHNALQGYRKLNAKALEQIGAGGIVFTFSCSQVISKEQFRLAVFSAAAQAGRKVRILNQLTQPADHPVNIYHPEGEYLKGLVLYVE